MNWLRFYVDILDDRRFFEMPAELYRRWTMLLCLTRKCDGCLPDVADVAFSLRISHAEAQTTIDTLRDEYHLIDAIDDCQVPHNWDKRQFASDNSTERVRAHRAKRSSNVSETPRARTEQNRTDTDSDTDVLRGGDAVNSAPAREDTTTATTLGELTGVTERLNGRRAAATLTAVRVADQRPTRPTLPRAPTDCAFAGQAAIVKKHLPDGIADKFITIDGRLVARDLDTSWQTQCRRIRDQCGRCEWAACRQALGQAHFRLASWAEKLNGQKRYLDNPSSALDRIFQEVANDAILAVSDPV